MAVNINASLSSGIGITSDNSGVIQFQSNGANTIAIAANGTVTTPAGIVVATASGSASGGLIRAPQILTSGTSYTTPVGCTAIYVEAVGAGGGCQATTDNNQASAGGGGGGYCAKYFTVTGNTAYSYVIGGGLANAAGGNTTFTVGGTTITAIGGSRGPRYTSNNAGFAGATGGGAINGDINVNGGGGGTGFVWSGPDIRLSSSGGSSVLGGGAAGTTSAGAAGGNYGGGAGGGKGASGTEAAGGNGVIRIWEFT